MHCIAVSPSYARLKKPTGDEDAHMPLNRADYLLELSCERGNMIVCRRDRPYSCVFGGIDRDKSVMGEA